MGRLSILIPLGLASCGGRVAVALGSWSPGDAAPLAAADAAIEEGRDVSRSCDVNQPSDTNQTSDADQDDDFGSPVVVDASPEQIPDSQTTADICVPQTCQGLGYECGVAGDRCGGLLNCNPNGGPSCPYPQFCGGGGFNQCGGSAGPLLDATSPIEHPATCQSLGYNCGFAGDGFGNLLDCGTCTPPEVCAAAEPNRCGLRSDGAVPCVPFTCASLGTFCGTADDGCGGTLTCGSCKEPDVCGGPRVGICGPPAGATDAGP